jgi:hypothetical protein
MAMVEEVREQFRTIKGLMEGTATPNYRRCVKISTDASLREMLPPGALVMVTPLVVGFLFGIEALSGVLVGSLISSVHAQPTSPFLAIPSEVVRSASFQFGHPIQQVAPFVSFPSPTTGICRFATSYGR